MKISVSAICGKVSDVCRSHVNRKDGLKKLDLELLMAFIRYKQNLEKIVNRIIYYKQVYKKDLQCGDLVIAFTKNSEYYISVLESGSYLVMGGWFDKKGLSPVEIEIRGCTWGGNIIKIDIIAACGLHLEFRNGLRTTVVKKVVVCRGNAKN